MKAHPRREFLLRVLAACGTPMIAPVVPACAGAGQTPQARPDDQADSRAAASYFGGAIGAARVIGAAYLSGLGIEPTRASILEHTGGTREMLATARNEKTALAALVSAVQRDFMAGRVLHLEGWVLSRTEVELCALTLLPEPL